MVKKNRNIKNLDVEHLLFVFRKKDLFYLFKLKKGKTSLRLIL